MLYPGRTHAFIGEPESGKTWLALVAVLEMIQAGSTCLYVDFEDDEDLFVEHMRNLGAEDALVAGRVAYVRPDGPFEGAAKTDLAVAVETLPRPPALVVLDGVTEAMALHGWNPDKMVDVAAFYAALPRRFDTFGAAVVMIDHVVKSKDERGRFAIGSQHKMAGINGAMFSFQVRRPFAIGAHGHARVTVTKDRPGRVRKESLQHKVFGEFHLRSQDSGIVVATVEPADATPEPTGYMERVSRYLEGRDEPVTSKDIETAVSGKATYIRQALEALMDGGYVERSTGDRGAKFWASILPYREDGEQGGSYLPLLSAG